MVRRALGAACPRKVHDGRAAMPVARLDTPSHGPPLLSQGVLALKFGTDARKLLVGASDHNLRVFSL